MEMKRAVAIILVVVLCVSLCACGAPKTFAEAVEKAEAKISKWDSQKYNGYYYNSYYPSEKGESFWVFMYTALDNPGMYTAFVAKTAAQEVYRDISKCFAALDTKIIILIRDEDEILYSFAAEDFN